MKWLAYGYRESICHQIIYGKPSASFRQTGHPFLGRRKLYDKTIQLRKGGRKQVIWEDIQLWTSSLKKNPISRIVLQHLKAAHSSSVGQIFSKQTSMSEVRVQGACGKVNRNISFACTERSAPQTLIC